jgi:hypothetical protein
LLSSHCSCYVPIRDLRISEDRLRLAQLHPGDSTQKLQGLNAFGIDPERKREQRRRRRSTSPPTVQSHQRHRDTQRDESWLLPGLTVLLTRWFLHNSDCQAAIMEFNNIVDHPRSPPTVSTAG